MMKANCGFSLVIVDLEDIAERLVRYVPLDVWYRFRLAAEKLSTALVFSTPFPVTGTSSALMLRLHSSGAALFRNPDFQGDGFQKHGFQDDASAHTRILHAFDNQVEIIRSRDLKKNVQSEPITFSSLRRWY